MNALMPIHGVSLGVRIFATVVLMSGLVVYATDQASVSDQQLTTEDIKNATPVATFTPEQFVRATDQYAKQQCRKGTVKATSDGAKIFLDSTSFSDDEFAAEIMRRNKQHPVYCLEIVGPGSDVKRTSALLRKLKGTEIENISWRPSK